MAIFRVDNGKIVEEWNIGDMLGIMLKRGIQIKPPPVNKAVKENGERIK